MILVQTKMINYIHSSVSIFVLSFTVTTACRAIKNIMIKPIIFLHLINLNISLSFFNGNHQKLYPELNKFYLVD